LILYITYDIIESANNYKNHMKKSFSQIALIVGILFIALALIYWLVPGKSLPHFFPGYSKSLATTHYKRAIVAFILGLVSFALAWFNKPKKTSTE
jgi:hypothetical protein